jgi:hypothetical protein
MDSASPFSTWLLDETFLRLEDNNDNLEDISDTGFLFGDNIEETASHGAVNETYGHEEQTSSQDKNANDDTIIDAVEERKKYVSTANDEWVVGYYSSLVTPEKLDFMEGPTKTAVSSDYVHYDTLSDMRSTFLFNDFSGEITTRKDGYLVEKPAVVQPCDLGSPFVLTMEPGGEVVLVVMPTKMSYGNLTLEICRERKNRYNDDNLPYFIGHMTRKMLEAKGKTSRARQQHYGYSGNNRVEGPRLHTVLTKEEVSKEHDTSKFVYTVKLLREIARDEKKKYEYSVIRKIGKAMQRQLRDVSKKFDKSITTHMSMWENAKYICTLLGDETRSCYELESNIVGCLHTSASIGLGLSPTHRDPGNAGWEWGALPDFHVNLTQNENIGFVVYIWTGDKRVWPIVVVQEKMASTYFYGANQMHGTIHIGTYLKVFNEHYEVTGLQLAVNVRDYWSNPVNDISTRVFVSYYTKHNLAMTSEVKKGLR